MEDQGQSFEGTGPTSFVKQNSGENKLLDPFTTYFSAISLVS